MNIVIKGYSSNEETLRIPDDPLFKKNLMISYTIDTLIIFDDGTTLRGDFTFAAKGFELTHEHALMRIRELFNK